MNDQLQKLTLYYDGKCPLCCAEIIFLSNRNHKQLLSFVDINTDQFKPQALGVSCEQAMAAMYGQFEDGTLMQGAPVFAHAYRRANLERMARFLSIPWLQPAFHMGYRFFAKNRYVISKIFGPLTLRIVRARNKATGELKN